MAKGCLLIVQVGGKGGQTRLGVVYTSGKMDPPHREFAEMAACYTLSSASDLQRLCLDCDYAPPFVSSTCQRVIDLQDGLDIDRVAVACRWFVAPLRDRVQGRLFKIRTRAAYHLTDSRDTVRTNPRFHRHCSLNVAFPCCLRIFGRDLPSDSKRHRIHASGPRRNPRRRSE